MSLPKIENPVPHSQRDQAAGRSLLVATVVLVALHLGKCLMFAAVGQPPLEGDAAHYWIDGQRMASGDWLLVKDGIELLRTPGYPLFGAIFQIAFGRYALVAITLGQQAMVLATAMITAWICRRVSGSDWGGFLGLVLSLLCVSRHGVALYLLSDTLFCLLLTSAVALLVAWQQQPSALGSAGIGLLFGLATLVRPIGQFAVVPILAAMAMQRRRGASWRLLLAHAACVLAAFAIALAPWYARNYHYCKQLCLARVAGVTMWQSLFKGSIDDRWNPAMPFADTPNTKALLKRLEGVNLQGHWDVLRALEAQKLTRMEANDRMQSVCIDAIQADPWRFVSTRLRRFLWFWITPNGARRPATASFHLFQERPPDAETAGLEPRESYYDAVHWRWDGYYRDGKLNWFWFTNPCFYLVTALLTGWGLIVMGNCRSQQLIAAALAMLLLYFATMTAIGAPPEYRYRMILEPMLIVAIVQLLLERGQWLTRKLRPELAPESVAAT